MMRGVSLPAPGVYLGFPNGCTPICEHFCKFLLKFAQASLAEIRHSRTQISIEIDALPGNQAVTFDG